VSSYNLSGMGCSAGIISIELVKNMLAAKPNSTALIVSACLLRLLYLRGPLFACNLVLCPPAANLSSVHAFAVPRLLLFGLFCSATCGVVMYSRLYRTKNHRTVLPHRSVVLC
jgi:hypothetical protein